MDTELGVYFNQQMHMVWHDFHLNEVEGSLSTNLLNKRFEPAVYPIDQDLTAIFWTPDHMIFTRIDHITVILIVHIAIISEEAI